jgi:hypothetical protein
MIAEQSVFENPPKDLSRKQVLIIEYLFIPIFSHARGRYYLRVS